VITINNMTGSYRDDCEQLYDSLDYNQLYLYSKISSVIRKHINSLETNARIIHTCYRANEELTLKRLDELQEEIRIINLSKSGRL
jgi:hypothetical protein